MLHLEELARLQLSKHARDLNAVEKRFGARGPKVTTQGSRRVARSAAGLVRANPHHQSSILQSSRPATQLAGAMDTTGRG